MASRLHFNNLMPEMVDGPKTLTMHIRQNHVDWVWPRSCESVQIHRIEDIKC